METQTIINIAFILFFIIGLCSTISPITWVKIITIFSNPNKK